MIPDLKIYSGRSVEKTYHVEEIDLEFGVVEDVIDALKIDSLQRGDAAEIVAAVIGAKNQVRPLLMDIFDGLTADEVRHTRLKNLTEVVAGIVNYFYAELGTVANEKN